MSHALRGMRLAVLGPISWPTPPPGYGPWEQIASNIATGMSARGLDVTLFRDRQLARTRKDLGRRAGRLGRGPRTQRRRL